MPSRSLPVQAYAKAISKSYLEAKSTCSPPVCEASLSVFNEALGKILVEAASKAVLSKSCAGASLILPTLSPAPSLLCCPASLYDPPPRSPWVLAQQR